MILRVRAVMDAPIAARDDIHLDGVVLSVHAGQGRLLTRSTPVRNIAYPSISIHRLRVDPLGVYLSSSWSFPDGRALGREHAVSRRDGEDVERLAGSFNRASGPGKDTMEPVYTVEAPVVEWTCVGRRGGLRDSLRRVRALGGFRRHGYGAIKRWEVEVVDGAPRDALMRDGVAARYLPADWLDDAERIERGPVIPPYWHAGLAVARVAPGTRCVLRDDVERALSRCR